MIILDTCSLLWLAADHSFLSEKAISQIKKYSSDIYVCSISALEIGIKVKRKKLSLPLSPKLWYEQALFLHGLHDLPVTWQVASTASSLPAIHDDPFDRLILASSIEYNATIITPDKKMKLYKDAKIIW